MKIFKYLLDKGYIISLIIALVVFGIASAKVYKALDTISKIKNIDEERINDILEELNKRIEVLEDALKNKPAQDIKFEPQIIAFNLTHAETETTFNSREYKHTWFDGQIICQPCYESLGPRYGFTDDDIYLLTQLICGDADFEGDGEYDFQWSVEKGYDVNYQEISKVLEVVMNRVHSDQFPNTVKEVIHQQRKGIYQFIVMPRNLNVTPNEACIQVIREWCEAYDRWSKGVQSIPKDHLYFHSGPNLTNITSTNWRR